MRTAKGDSAGCIPWSIDTAPLPAKVPAKRTVPDPTAKTGVPGSAGKSTPRCPRWLTGSGALKARTTSRQLAPATGYRHFWSVAGEAPAVPSARMTPTRRLRSRIRGVRMVHDGGTGPGGNFCPQVFLARGGSGTILWIPLDFGGSGHPGCTKKFAWLNPVVRPPLHGLCVHRFRGEVTRECRHNGDTRQTVSDFGRTRGLCAHKE